MDNMEKVVLDTNVFLVSISTKSPLHWIFRALLDGKYVLCVTTDILFEYAEIIDRHIGEDSREAVLGALENLPNVELITRYFRWNLLLDPDDNAFVDCAIAANAHCIVSHDNDFKRLRAINFPKVEVKNTDEFKALILPS